MPTPTNVPATVWQDPLGLIEFGGDSSAYIVDTTGAFLVDPSTTYIVDTGVTADLIPATVWESDDSI